MRFFLPLFCHLMENFVFLATSLSQRTVRLLPTKEPLIFFFFLEVHPTPFQALPLFHMIIQLVITRQGLHKEAVGESLVSLKYYLANTANPKASFELSFSTLEKARSTSSAALLSSSSSRSYD